MSAGDRDIRERWDAIVLGGGISGLVAAAYLAKARRRTLLLEARDVFGGLAESGTLVDGVRGPFAADNVYAIDPQTFRELALHKRGVRFVQRAMPLIALRPGGRHLVLPHDSFAARAVIREESAADADAFLRFRRALFYWARHFRRLWSPREPSENTRGPVGTVADTSHAFSLSDAQSAFLDLVARQSANAHLARWFETDTLRALLAFDAIGDASGPDEAGSALKLVWRAAQECSGLQGATGQIRGTPSALANAIVQAAEQEGVVLETGAKVANVDVANGAVTGVTLQNGTQFLASVVVSALGMTRTRKFLVPDLLPFGSLHRLPGASRLGTAKVVFVLKGHPPFVALPHRALAGRMIVAERPESAAEARGAAIAGELPSDLVMEVTVPTILDPGLSRDEMHIVSVRIPALPFAPREGWQASESVLMKRVLATLERYAPGIGARVIEAIVLTPNDFHDRYGVESTNENDLQRLLTPVETRVRTHIDGLYVCGADTESSDAISGLSGRIAAAAALAAGIGRKEVSR